MCGGEGKFAQVCGRDGCRTRLALDKDGNLWKAQVKFAVNADWRGKIDGRRELPAGLCQKRGLAAGFL